MRRQRIHLPNPFKQGLGFPIKAIAVTAIAFLVLSFIIWRVGEILKTLDFLRIKQVLSNRSSVIDLNYLKGRNIFEINLKKEAKYLSELYPTYRKIRLIKVLPNRLYIDFLERQPQAYVKLHRYLCIDDELVLFDVPLSAYEMDLPLILGLETKILAPKTGKKYNLKELAIALRIIKEFRKNNLLKDYKIKIIDVANLNNTLFSLLAPYDNTKDGTFRTQTLEIRVGQEDIGSRLAILSSLVVQLKKEWDNIKYIDLRFKEPVIKLK